MAPKLKPGMLEKKRVEILKAALTCFARKGYHQTTMEDIVDEVGLSKGGLYWHFSSKRELFLEMFEFMMGQTEAAMQGLLPTEATAQERLVAVLSTFEGLVTSREFRELAPLLVEVWAQNRQDPEVNEVTIDLYRRFRRPIEEVIMAGVTGGEFKPVDANALAGILMAVYDGLMVQWMIDKKIVNWTAVTDTLRNTLIRGLLAGE